MAMTRSRKALLLAALTALALVLAGCGGDDDGDATDATDEAVEATEDDAAEPTEEEAEPTEDEATEPTEDDTAEATEDDAATEEDDAAAGDAEEVTGGPYTIGVSNGFVGSEWRTQMIDNLEAAVEEYGDAIDELIIESADVDVNGQIQQVRNLISAGVDAIIINPNSPTALDAVFQEAADQGIVVVATDQAVETESVVNVVIDQAEWGRVSAEWLADTLGEGAQIVAVNGIAGHPANEARWGAAQEVFDEAGIEVLTVANGNWDQATGQQVMSDLLATYPELDGVWTQDGMAEGVFRALDAAGRLGEVQPTGEARVGYMRLWEQTEGFETIGVVNPPGAAVAALHTAIALLEGREIDPAALDGNTLFLPIPEFVTVDNFDEVWAEVQDRPDTYSVDEILTRAEVLEAYFQ